MNVPTRTISALPTGTAFSRWLIALAKGGGDPVAAAEVADQHYRDTPTVAATFNYHQKGPITAGSTSDSAWAGALAQYGIGAEAWALLQSASILGKLQASFRRVPFRVKVSREITSGAGGAWVGEALPMPIASTAFDVLQQEHHTAWSAIMVSRELLQFGSVSEAASRNVVIAGVSKYIDGQLLDPTVGPATSARPASLLWNAAPITQSGTTGAAILLDLSNMIAAIESPGDSLRWVMKPITYYTVCARLAAVGYPTTPNMLLGIPVVTGSTSPRQIALIDGSAVAFSADDIVVLDVTTEATIQAADTGLTPASTAISLFQSNVVAIRAGVSVAWQHAYMGTTSPSYVAGAAYMTTTY